MKDRAPAPKARPPVSVVIPTYNGEAWIEETLVSVFEQTQLPDEIIVVDDASTDQTVQIVSGIADGAPVPIRVIRLETNTGSPAPVLNVGISRAAGDFIAVLDHDDVFTPTKIEQQAATLASDAGLAFVFSLYDAHHAGTPLLDRSSPNSRVWRSHGRMSTQSRRMRARDRNMRYEGHVVLEELARSGNFIGGFAGFMFRKGAWESKGGLDEGLKIAADYDFLCWLSTHGDVRMIPEVHYLRREHGANLSLSSGIQWRLDSIRVLLRYADFHSSSDTPQILRGSIRHQLWAIARRLASGGRREAASTVSDAARRMQRSHWRNAVQLMAIPAYVVYYRLRGRPWRVTAEQSSEATELAISAERQLG